MEVQDNLLEWYANFIVIGGPWLCGFSLSDTPIVLLEGLLGVPVEMLSYCWYDHDHNFFNVAEVNATHHAHHQL